MSPNRLSRTHWLPIALLGLGAALAASADPARAQAVPRDQAEPDVVYKIDREEYQLVWVEDRGAGHRIYSKRLRPNGLPIGGDSGGEWELTTPAGAAAAGQKGAQRTPAVIDGFVVWSEKAPGGADYDLYIQRLFENGRANGYARLLLARPGDQMYPDIVAVSRGLASELLVVWSENTTDGGDVMGIRLTHALAPRGQPFAIASGQGTAEDPVIDRDLRDDDSLLVLWTDNRAGNKDIYGTRLLESGLPRGGPAVGDFPVIQTPAEDYAPAIVVSLNPSRRAGGADPSASAEGSPNTRGILVWTTDDAANGPDVVGQRLFSNGLPLGRVFPIAAGAGVQAWPSVTLRTERRPSDDEIEQAEWLATWADQSDPSATTLDVRGVEIQLNGISRRQERTLATD